MSLQDWTDTDRAVAPAVATTLLPNPKMLSRLMEQSRPACSHYDRNCTIISPCCGLAFGCRICHDECPILPPPLSLRRKHRLKDDSLLMPTMPHGTTAAAKERRRSMPLDIHDINDDIETHHLIDRFSIREVICRQCFERQSSKTYVIYFCWQKFTILLK
jgi:RING finger/CHY zinc finger protein 1